MMAEVLTALEPHARGRYVDGTIGGGGHATAILAASSPSGWLFGCDRDGVALEVARQRLAAQFGGRFELRRGNYADLAEWLEPASCDAVLLDLGVSSPQLDQPDRGFSFQAEGPLDMRMDDRQALTAGQIVNGWSESELAQLFWELGGEPKSRRIARALVEQRQRRQVETTAQLAKLVETLVPRGKNRHPATRVFQALRMAVNDELRSLERGLAAACSILKTGGRLAVISFHSGEDRLVKQFGREQTRDYTVEGERDIPELRCPRLPVMKWLQRKAIQPSAVEVAENPRARSAQLRVLEKIQTG